MSSKSTPQTPDSAAARGGEVVMRPAGGDEVHEAVGLLLAESGQAAGPERVMEFLRGVLQRGVNLEQLWVAEGDGKLRAAALAVPGGGRTMLVLCGGRTTAWPAAARRLIEGLCHRHAGQIHLAEALLEPGDQDRLHVYSTCGFELIAELIYLEAAPPRDAPWAQLPQGMHWMTYGPQNHALFCKAILRSYEQSLDCPALSGRRAIEDIIAGHRACGIFDPQRWLLLCADVRPLGAMLLTQPLGQEGLELMYLGLSPEARGRGLGDVMVRQALWMAAQQRERRLSLAVDAANAPALGLYFRHGFRRMYSKLALLRDLRQDAPAVPPDVHIGSRHVQKS